MRPLALALLLMGCGGGFSGKDSACSTSAYCVAPGLPVVYRQVDGGMATFRPWTPCAAPRLVCLCVEADDTFEVPCR